jgi:hypothetical protein
MRFWHETRKKGSRRKITAAILATRIITTTRSEKRENKNPLNNTWFYGVIPDYRL